MGRAATAAAGPARALGRSGEEGTLGFGGGQAGQGGSGLGQTQGLFPLFFYIYFPKHFPKQLLNKNKR